MTPEQLQAIRKRLSLGSEGAWVKTGDWVRADGIPVVECIHGNSEQAEADADLIAHAPTDLRALLDEVERLKALAQELHVERHKAQTLSSRIEDMQKERATRIEQEIVFTAALNAIASGRDNPAEIAKEALNSAEDLW